MGSVGMPEILLIFLVVLLVFGAKRIPEIARGLGNGIREFKDATTDIKREITQDSHRIQPPQYGAPTPYVNTQQQAPVAAAPAPAPAPQPAPQESTQPAENRA